MANRVAERQDAMEDVLSEMFVYGLEIALQEMDRDIIARYAGPEGAQYWPEVNKMEMFDLVKVEIGAGSTGKPNEIRKLNNFRELYPLFQDTLFKMIEMQQLGITFDQNPLKRLLEEGLKRLDERMDIDEFLAINQNEQQSGIVDPRTGQPFQQQGQPQGQPGNGQAGPPISQGIAQQVFNQFQPTQIQ